MQCFTQLSDILLKGSEALLQGMKAYEAHEAVVKPWRNAFVDLVQVGAMGSVD